MKFIGILPVPRLPVFVLKGLLLFAWTARAQVPAVVINEINYAPSDAQNPAEFIELYNHSENPVDLSGWKFDAGVNYVFPPSTILPAGGYLVISGDPAGFNSRWGFIPLGPWDGRLANEGEQLRLRDSLNNTVDVVTYGRGFPWPTAAAGDGSSMELIHPGLDNNLGGAWRSSGLPTGNGEPQVYVPPNDVSWRYRKGTNEASNPVGAWRLAGFIEDDTWTTAQSSIGYADNDDHTILTDMQNRYSSLFLRRVFNMEPGAVPAALKVRARVDDGCIVWINGQEVARFHVEAGLVPAHDSLAQNHEADVVAFESVNVANANAFLTEGPNIVAVQAFNSSLGSSDFSIDVSIEELAGTGDRMPTPGSVNSCFAQNAAPAIRQVTHQPTQPQAGEDVIITARISDPDGVGPVLLKYQGVNPGGYLRKTDAAYAAGWITIPMHDDGTNGDTNAGDFVYTAVLPGPIQVHRRLVRYRIVAEDLGGRSVEVPYADDGSPNFAYFVFNGPPAWSGAFAPGVTPLVSYSSNVLESLPTYHLIATASDVINSQYNSTYNGQRFYGTLVYDGRVYDHVQFNNRGEASTYVSGKNKWRFHFNRTREFEPRDNWDRKYGEPWNELNLNAAASPWCAVHRGMGGVEEAVSLRFYELIGMASPRSHFLHFRVIDDSSESSLNQFQGGDSAGLNTGGDLWGLYLAVEQPDGSFLEERELPDGNVYKIEGSTGDRKHQGEGQPSDNSDWNSFLSASKQAQTEAWWRNNLNLEAYYNFHAGNRIVGNVDVRPGFNHYFYHAPDGRWQVIPWDLDMMFIPKTHWPGIIDQNRCLDVPALRIEFQNRARELLDLMCSDPGTNGGQIVQLIDEYAQMIAPPGTVTNWATLDAAMWNMNPRTSAGTNPQTSHRGNFHRTPYTDSRMGGTWVRTLATPDFAGSMKYLKDYAVNTFPPGSSWAVNNGDPRGYGYQYLFQEGSDSGAPQRPSATYLGGPSHPIDDLRFSASAHAGVYAYAATQWRVGEISAPGIPQYDPERPRIYEVTDVWRSSETPSNGTIVIPADALQVGRTYRVRVRHKDVTGRWSRWSEPVQFVTAPALTAIASNQLVVSEFMYHPPPLSPAETAAGFTDRQAFEYVELFNISSNVLNLEGLAFTNGITFVFGPGELLDPGERILAVKSTNAFLFRYGAAGRIAGEYAGQLDNSGERVVLNSIGQAVHDFTYSDGSHPPGEDPWPVGADGPGPSLVLMNPETAPDHRLASNWRPSTGTNGSPGISDRITYAEWSRRYPGLGGPEADDDDDGWKNDEEYVFGASPVSEQSAPERVQGAVEFLSVDGQSDAYLVFTFTRSAEIGDATYHVEFSEDLQTWVPAGVRLAGIPSGDGRVTERWRGPQPLREKKHLFARLRVAIHTTQ